MEATAIVPARSPTWLLVVARMIHFLKVICCFYLSPRLSWGDVDDSDSVVVPLGRGHADRTGQVLGMFAGGREDDPPLNCDVLVYISPTQVDSWQP
jgi:hypothetical protein